MTAIRIDIEGKEGVHEMLSAYADPEMTKRLKTATKAGAKVFVRPLKSEARGISRRMANSVKVLVNKKDKPGHYVAFRGKGPANPYFKHMVIGGTKDHGPKRVARVSIGRFSFGNKGAAALVFVPGWNPYMNRAPRKGKVGGGWVRAQRVKGVGPRPIVTGVANSYETQAWAAFDKSLDSTEAR